METIATMPAGLASFGPVMQLAYVVPDIRTAMAWWSGTIGVGPFFLSESSRQADVRYRGERASVDISMALSYWNGMQIELIQPNDERPSIYREAMGSEQRGLHHVSVHAQDMAAVRAAIAVARGTVIHEARLPGGALLYADLHGGPGAPLYEVLQPPGWLLELFAAIRDAAQDWNGQDPVRPFR